MRPNNLLLWPSVGIFLAALATGFGQPMITKQPANQTASLFADAAFSLLVSGDPPLSYQWRFNNADLPGATNRTLSITNVQRSNAGDYNVVVSNPSGSITSQVAALTITPFNSMYCFGFSWTDTQGLSTDGSPNFANNSPNYWQNRASNGPMWPEYLSTNVGLAYNPANNYARGGATPNDILNQIINFPAPPKPQLALYCLWRGRPDVTLSTATNPPALDRVLQSSILINSNSVNRLYTKGARVILFQFGVSDMFDFSGLTTDNALNSALLAKASEYSNRFKSELVHVMRTYMETKPDLRLLFFDGSSNFNKILAEPLKYGFTNITDPVVGNDALTDHSFTGPGADYLNWDFAHATTKLHRLMANWNFEVLTNSILEKLDATTLSGLPMIRMNHQQIGRDYTLQSSSDLIHWQETQSFTAAAGTNQWTGASVEGSTSFYRLKFQPWP